MKTDRFRLVIFMVILNTRSAGQSIWQFLSKIAPFFDRYCILLGQYKVKKVKKTS